MENPGSEISSVWMHSLYHEVFPFLLQHAGGCVHVCDCVCVFPFTLKAQLLLLLVSFLDSTFWKRSPVLVQGLTALSAIFPWRSQDRQPLLG